MMFWIAHSQWRMASSQSVTCLVSSISWWMPLRLLVYLPQWFQFVCSQDRPAFWRCNDLYRSIDRAIRLPWRLSGNVEHSNIAETCRGSKQSIEIHLRYSPRSWVSHSLNWSHKIRIRAKQNETHTSQTETKKPWYRRLLFRLLLLMLIPTVP